MLFELRLQFLFYFHRHSCRLRKVPEHVGIALLRTGKRPFCVFPVAHAVSCFGNRGERHAHPQVRSDEVNPCSFDFIPESQVFVEEVAHIQILGDHHCGSDP